MKVEQATEQCHNPSLRVERWPHGFANTVLLTLLLCHFACPLAAQTSAKNVLVLFSLSDRHDFSAFDDLKARMKAATSLPLNFYVENLEARRFDDADYTTNLLTDLRTKYHGVKLDLVITEKEPALQFAAGHRDDLFPGVPVVFYDLEVTNNELKTLPGITGVTAPADVRGTIEFALRLEPDTNTVAIVTGKSPYERYWLAQIHSELLRYQNREKEVDLVSLPAEKVLERIDSLPPNTIVLFQLARYESLEPAIGTYDLLSLIAQHRPTFCVFAWNCVTRGGIGGDSYDGYRQIDLVSGLAKRVLAGESPNNIPIVHDAKHQIFVDWRQLQKWHISESALPPNSVVLFKPASVWDLYRGYVIMGISLILLEAALIVGLIWQRASRRKAEEALADLSGRLIQAQEDERGRIAREIHDDFQQRLAMLAIDLDHLARNPGQNDTAASGKLRDLWNSVGELGSDLHSLSHQLHSSTLESLGLAEALRALCEEFKDHHDIDVTFSEENVPRKLPPDAALCLFRIAQEALQNVRKHSHANKADVRLVGLGNNVHLSIADPGMGFDSTNGARRGGIGIRSMEERLRLVKGRFAIHSRLMEGTRIDALVPIHAETPNRI